jgi:multiple sugar transport system permease protein
VRHGGIVLAAAAFLFPFFWMGSNALRPDCEVFAMPPRLFPSAMQWHDFVEAWQYLPFGRFFLNSALSPRRSPRSCYAFPACRRTPSRG